MSTYQRRLSSVLKMDKAGKLNVLVSLLSEKEVLIAFGLV
jgi:hypothetical protein